MAALELPTPPAALRDHLGAARAAMARALDQERASGRAACTLLSDGYDELVRAVWDWAWGEAQLGAGAGELALVATGGWGRRELCPYSDIDFILVTPARAAGSARRLAECMLYPLWDAGIQVGHAVRTPRDAAHLAADDLSTATALLDLRWVAGSRALTDELARAARHVIAPGGNANGFVKQLAGEQARRADKFGDSLYLLEPNLKHGIGALRDLDTALWAAKARWSIRTPAELVPIGQLTPRQARLLGEALDFLLMLRTRLQLQVGRATDQLTFESQEAIAPSLYPDAEPAPGHVRPAVAPAVEALMQRYYLHARAVRRLSDRVLEMARVPARRKPRIRRVDPVFLLFNGKVSVKDPATFRDRPAEMVRLFRVALELSLPIYGHTAELIAERLAQTTGGGDSLLTGDPAAAGLFLDALVDVRDRGQPSLLEQMHQIGILNALMPEFAPCTCRVQHDLYHVYTVDQHQLLAVAMLKRLARGELASEYPTATQAIAEVIRPRSLYLGTLLHDVGKPLGKGHADKGARLAGIIAERLGVDGDEVETAEFLVRQHLTMAHLSQRRDLSDPDVIARFAERVGDEQRLLQLYLCTLCDTAMTAPGNLSAWKNQLLEELYRRTRRFLRGEADADEIDLDQQVSRTRERARSLLLRAGSVPAPAFQEPAGEAPARVRSEAEIDACLDGVDARLYASLSARQVERLVRLAWANQSAGAEVEITVSYYPLKGYSELDVVAADRHGLLASVAAALAANRIDVLGAVIGSGRILGAAPVALDVFFVRDLVGKAISFDDGRWARFREDLHALVAAGLSHEAELELLSKRRRSGLAPRVTPGVATVIQIDNEASAEATVVEVFTQDRMGVLHAITRTLADLDLDIHVSKISTEGERVADVFYVSRSADAGKLTARADLDQLEARLRSALDEV
ncbi:[protein-PII] uridylyltransferase [Haliangium sp.]|uniref:[protein-PII] uridylyltransferase n=1 Tax=Haliangium sp. TaxID=2663208 RepID=UPI003D10BDE0